MKKSVVFLINGLGIEKAGSYSIAIDQCMPNLSRTKETSYFTTAIISSLEYKSAYEKFFLGETYRKDIEYIQENIINTNVTTNPTYQQFVQSIQGDNKKIHIFLEPSNDKIIEQVNNLVNTLPLGKDQPVFLHLLLTQQSVNEYNHLISTINYIKYHINSNITVGFIIGKEIFKDDLSTEEVSVIKKLLFLCSAERWSDTGQKLLTLKEQNVRPCVAPGFCATNDCKIANNDVIMFFNTKRTSYDKIIEILTTCAPDYFKNETIQLPVFSLIQLDTKYSIPCFAQSIQYDNTLSNIMARNQKKALIITDDRNISYVNFLANGFNYVNNPNIQFMKLNDEYINNPQNISNVIDNTSYDLIIFDYHMDVSSTVNDLKDQLTRIDATLGIVANTCVNKHSLFITSLYGLKKTLPLAPYNPEVVTIDYEMQIPIFFFDYTYPRSKYVLRPGETNDILQTAIKCICDDNQLESLIMQRGIINNLLSIIKK